LPILKKIKLISTFYRSFCLGSLLTTAIGVFLSWEYGSSIFLALLVLKAAVLYIIYIFIKRYKGDEFFYYRNLGLSKFVLWSTTLFFDMAIYLLLITQISRIR
jgi:hypothetical protein